MSVVMATRLLQLRARLRDDGINLNLIRDSVTGGYVERIDAEEKMSELRLSFVFQDALSTRSTD